MTWSSKNPGLVEETDKKTDSSNAVWEMLLQGRSQGTTGAQKRGTSLKADAKNMPMAASLQSLCSEPLCSTASQGLQERGVRVTWT